MSLSNVRKTCWAGMVRSPLILIVICIRADRDAPDPFPGGIDLLILLFVDAFLVGFVGIPQRLTPYTVQLDTEALPDALLPDRVVKLIIEGECPGIVAIYPQHFER